MIFSLKQKIVIAIIGIVILAFGATILIFEVKGCEKDQQIAELQERLAENQDGILEQVDKHTKAIETLPKKEITRKDVGEEIAKQLKKHKLDAVYQAQTEGTIDIKRTIAGSAKVTKIVTHEKTSETIVTDPKVVAQCNTCLASSRIVVPFEGTEGPIHVIGQTMTGPSLSEPGTFDLKISVLKDIAFEIVLAQGKDGKWQSFINTEDEDLEFLKLKSTISMKPFRTPWYKKFAFPMAIMLTDKFDVSVTIGAYYKFLKHISFGIQGGIMFMRLEERAYRFHYGVGVIFHS